MILSNKFSSASPVIVTSILLILLNPVKPLSAFNNCVFVMLGSRGFLCLRRRLLPSALVVLGCVNLLSRRRATSSSSVSTGLIGLAALESVSSSLRYIDRLSRRRDSFSSVLIGLF